MDDEEYGYAVSSLKWIKYGSDFPDFIKYKPDLRGISFKFFFTKIKETRF